MRRSKSNPAKYAKNYRSISQRRMTTRTPEVDKKNHHTPKHTKADDTDELQRVCRDLREIEAKLQGNTHPTTNDDGGNNDNNNNNAENPQLQGGNNNNNILSDDLLTEYGAEELVLVTTNRTKKNKHQRRSAVRLTPAELKQATATRKQLVRKVKTLEARAAARNKRQALYQTLEATAVSTQASALLHKSAHRGKHITKREQLQRVLRKERAGLALSAAEQELLYPTNNTNKNNTPARLKLRRSDDSEDDEHDEHDNGNHSMDVTATAVKKRKLDGASSSAKKKASSTTTTTAGSGIEEPNDDDDNGRKCAAAREAPTVATAPAVKPKESSGVVSVAAQMMASLSSLKQKTDEAATTPPDNELTEKQHPTHEMDDTKRERKPYVPADAVPLKTTQSYQPISAARPTITTNTQQSQQRRRHIERPAAIAATRYERLPVLQMEFEVTDAILTHDVTLVCAETGSGKSTQVPQFLYEAGYGQPQSPQQPPDNNNDKDQSRTGTQSTQHNLYIGVTQPRRVAAISTAKRVCYEMGQGDGQSIRASSSSTKDQGNLVAYQTRYETAGLGSATCIKFMTDGILLREIQSDLLLRNYAVIVLDEAHERNLNTDVLIGLLTKAIPLRKVAAAQGRLPPLKLVIMSATLRVQDFTGDHLFATTSNAMTKMKTTSHGKDNGDDGDGTMSSSRTRCKVVTVPGRTYPVTVHHTKTTELEQYEDDVFRKVSKIHRQLPQGGILVFLTGKQEILRMVNRLRKALQPSSSNSVSYELCRTSDRDSSPSLKHHSEIRELDDVEADDELYVSDEHDLVFENDNQVDAVDLTSSDENDPIPRKVVILPLYSLLSTEDQAKVFAPVPDGCRLIVVATNIAETSITIPGVSYVVDSGRQKCRNYNCETGVASFDIMWISRAAADQRAGRAGRTGPGQCYRLYSSSLYSRHMDEFALPEVLIRPLEDVVLSMKAMKISNVSAFPFPTPPNRTQIDMAAEVLASIGCISQPKGSNPGSDGVISPLGTKVSQLPLGVRYGKILVVAAEAGVLEYAVAAVAALSESTPFLHRHAKDSEKVIESMNGAVSNKRTQWFHAGGDVLAAVLAVGAFNFAMINAWDKKSKIAACRQFCDENELDLVVMQRIHKMQTHLSILTSRTIHKLDTSKLKKTGFAQSIPPPSKLQELLLRRSITSGFLDNVALLAPYGSLGSEHPTSLRSAYIHCSSPKKHPLFLDQRSSMYSKDTRHLPRWIVFEGVSRRVTKSGSTISIMKNITPIDPKWLGPLAFGSQLLSIGDPLSAPLPLYDVDTDAVLCSVTTKYGYHRWEIPSIYMKMLELEESSFSKKQVSFLSSGDSFRWFARLLLEGKVFSELKDLPALLNDRPSLITGEGCHTVKAEFLVSALIDAGINSASALRKHWAEVDEKLLLPVLKKWSRSDTAAEVKRLWIACVNLNVSRWNEQTVPLTWSH